MVRLQPDPGYITARQTLDTLRISYGTLSRYVEQGRLKRYGPPGRKHKFYKLSEVEALRESLLVFEPEGYQPGQWRKNVSSTFAPAQEGDMERIVEISNAIFQDRDHPIPMTPIEIRLSWLRKNPKTFYVLRNEPNQIVGYASMLALAKEKIDLFIRGQLSLSAITADDVELFEPGHPLHIYIMAVCVDPEIKTVQERHEYGARLIAGLFGVFLDLGSRGVEVETITARSRLSDGKRLLRKMGIPQIISPNPRPAMSLYAVRVNDSGLPIFAKYREALSQWKIAQRISQEIYGVPDPANANPGQEA